MIIEVMCPCGKRVVVNEDLEADGVNCIRCGRLLKLPPKAPPQQLAEVASVPEEAAAPHAGSARDSVYWLIVFCFVPLAFSLGKPEIDTFEHQLRRTLKGQPESVRRHVEEVKEDLEHGFASLDDLFAVLPEDRLDGAFLPRRTWLHWGFALATSAGFLLLISLCFSGHSKPVELLAVGLFTATFGIAILLFLHHYGPVALFIQACFVADAGQQPDFFATWAVYTFAVGLFEEAVKLVPLGWYLHRHRRMAWRQACLWGLASGVGFGVSEGIMYSAEHYNGVAGGELYLVRFASCVALHAIWTASASISLYYCLPILRALLKWDELDVRAKLASAKDRPLYAQAHNVAIDWHGLALVLLRVLVVVMFLHGLYDAALMRGLYPVALGAAIVSFGWLAWQIEGARRQESETEETGTTKPELDGL